MGEFGEGIRKMVLFSEVGPRDEGGHHRGTRRRQSIGDAGAVSRSPRPGG